MKEQELDKYLGENVHCIFQDGDVIIGKLFKVVNHEDVNGNLHSVKNGYYVEYINHPHAKGIDFCKSLVKKIKRWSF